MSTSKKNTDNTTQTRLSRRNLLVGSTTALASVGLMGLAPLSRADTTEAPKSALPDYANWKDENAVIVHSANTLETRRGAIGSGVVTPSKHLYVRNNLPAPGPEIVADRDAWEVRIEGVNNPATLTLAELKEIGIESVTAVLQCSGNGRQFFTHGPGGTQWGTGAAGCVVWTGVPLRDVVAKLGGVKEGMEYITGTGGEALPAGLDPKTIMVERSIPTRALDQAILAWELNDEALPLTHGGPLRLVVPGYYGVNNVKYVKQVAFTVTQTDAKIQASGYRIRDVGVKGAPDQPSMWEMPVKSWVTAPLEKTRQGHSRIHGVAFGGNNPLDKVEVSVDGGKNWLDAQLLGPDMGRFAWRPFALSVDLAPGEYLIVSRATDAQGNIQPQNRTENERGYGNASWSDHGVSVTVS